MSSLQSQDGKTLGCGEETRLSMEDMTAIEVTQGMEEEKEEDKEEVVEAEAEVAEEMTTKKTEGWNHLELAEVATEEMRGEDTATNMMITRAIREDMEAEMTPGGEDMRMIECMKNTVIEIMIGTKRKTEIETTTRTGTEAMGEVVPTGMEAARENKEVARRLRAIGGLPQAFPWLQGTSRLW